MLNLEVLIEFENNYVSDKFMKLLLIEDKNGLCKYEKY